MISKVENRKKWNVSFYYNYTDIRKQFMMIFLNAWYKSCCLIIFPNIIRCSLVVFVTGLENWIESLYNAWSLGDTLPGVLFYNSIVVSERQKWTKSHKWYRIKYFKFKAIILTSYKLQQEFLGHWDFWVNEYSYNIYDNGNFREFDYIITVRYMYDICLVYNFPSFI